MWHRLVAKAAPLDPAHPTPSASDVALLQYTGGTTGTPKGAMLTHRNLVANAVQGHAWTGTQPGTDVVYGVLPFFHAFGLTLCLSYAIRVGATLVAFPSFDPERVLDAQRRLPGHVPAGGPADARPARGRRRHVGRRPHVVPLRDLRGDGPPGAHRARRGSGSPADS